MCDVESDDQGNATVGSSLGASRCSAPARYLAVIRSSAGDRKVLLCGEHASLARLEHDGRPVPSGMEVAVCVRMTDAPEWRAAMALEALAARLAA